ncbi:MAG: saccharopine dehydrogenase family protein [Gammaproteobacteria bacterium]
MPAQSANQLFTVVVLGGYGNFGMIISRALAAIPSVGVIVAGRDYQQANALAASIGARAAKVDIDANGLAEKLAKLGTNLVISTVGPFQGQDYRVAEAAIATRAHYVDLADARDFVIGISALNAAALAQDVLVTSGASSVPALSSAVIDSLLSRFSRLDEIHHGISSSEKIPGVATVAAVLGYCGKPLTQWRDGQWTKVFGWQESRPHDFPAPLGRRWVANCDVPDLELFPDRFPSVRSVRFSAGVGLKISQLGIWLLSWLVRAKLLANAAVVAKLLRKAGILLECFGDGLSGMFVTLQGLGPVARPRRITWQLVARQNHGPNIPCMAAVALARKLASGRLSVRGAQPCVGLVSADEYLAELHGFDIKVALTE